MREVIVGDKELQPEQVYRVVSVDYLYTHPRYARSPATPEIKGRIRRE